MRTQFSKLVQVAALGFALAFTYSCSSSDDNGGDGSSSSNNPGSGGASETAVIGGKIWMAKNLSVDVPGSKCYGEGISGVSADSIAKNCAKDYAQR